MPELCVARGLPAGQEAKVTGQVGTHLSPALVSQSQSVNRDSGQASQVKWTGPLTRWLVMFLSHCQRIKMVLL
jgi:hypothetical protein